MKRLLRVLAAIALAFAALLVVLCLYLAFGDLGRHKTRIEHLVTGLIGREFAIDGPLSLKLMPAISLRAEKVRIGNLPWGSTPHMLDVGRLAAEIDLWSLISGPVNVHSLELRDVTVTLERDPKGGNNWSFGNPNAPKPPPDESDEGMTKLPIAVEHAMLSNLRVTYRAPGQQDRLEQVESLTIEPGSDGLLAVDGKGSVENYAATLTGELGPLHALLSGRDIRMAIQASLGNLQVVAKGAVGQLYPLHGADLKLTADNPDLGTMLRNLRLPEFADGQLHLDASLKNAGERTHVELQALAGDISASVAGTIATLGLRESDLEISLKAPDAARLAAVFDVSRVPAEKLEVAGHLATSPTKHRPDGRSIRINMRAALGGLQLNAIGGVARLDPLEGADLRLMMDDPDIGSLLKGLSLPAVAEGPLHLNVSVASVGKRTKVDLQGKAGDITTNVAGTIASLGLRDVDLEISLKAPDAARLAAVFDVSGVPAEKLEVAGHLATSPTKHRPDGRSISIKMRAALGDLQLNAIGGIARLDPLEGADLRLMMDDPDIGALLKELSLPAVAEGPLHLNVSVGSAGKRTKIDLQGKAGDITANVAGTIASLGWRDVDLEFSLKALDAAHHASALDVKGIPAGKLDVAGHVTVSPTKRKPTGQSIRMKMRGALGDLHLDATGSVVRLDPLEGADAKVKISDPNIGALLKELNLPAVADGPLDVDATISNAGKRANVDLRAKAGDITTSVTGTIATLGLRDSDLRFKAEALDAARLAAAFDVKDIAAAKLEVAGHMAASSSEMKFDGVTARLGATQGRIDGTLPMNRDQPLALRFDISAQSLADVQATLPPLPLKVSGSMTHAPDRFELTNLIARVGKTDIEGNAMLQGGEHQHIEADISARMLDLTPLVSKPAPAAAPAEPAPRQPPAPKKEYLFPTTPLPVARLQKLDARLHLMAGELRADKLLLKGVDATLKVNNGKLLAQLHANGGYSGRLEGSANLTRSGSHAAALKVDLKLHELRAGLAGGDTVRNEEVPPVSLTAHITASGSSPRQLAAGANGSFLFSMGPGKAERGALSMVGSDVIGQLFSKLNPFAKEDPFTHVDCSVARIDILHGKSAVAPVLLQTGKVTVTAEGKVDLGTEALEFDFNTRPRSGIGISPGMFTNPFLELRGTLASPRLGVGAKGATAGALAAATAGATVIAKGLVDRAKGEVDMCKQTLEAAQHPAGSGRQPP